MADSPTMNPLLAQVAEQLDGLSLGVEMLEATKKVAKAVILALDQPNVTEDTIMEVALAALGDAIERADTAVRAAEQRLERK